MARLENWSMSCSPHPESDPYKAPEQRVQFLQGNVYGHTGFNDGEWIHTSQIMSVDGRKVQTRNTLYELGTVSPKYLEWCKASGHTKYDLEGDHPLG